MQMRSVLVSAVVVGMVLVALPAVAEESGGLRYTVTVTEFENEAGWAGQWDIGNAWGTIMTDLLNQTGRFIVLGESDMRQAALEEQDFAASGRTAGGAKAPATGQMTPAQLLVKGAITHVQNETSGGGGGLSIGRVRVGGSGGKAEVNATIYLVDSTTGQVVASTSVVGKAKRRGGRLGYSGNGWGGDFNAFKKDNVGKAVESAVADAVDWLTAQLDGVKWRGAVVMARDGKVYINRGSREGVASGQTFVIGTAEELRDPDTGELLDVFVTQVARIRADSVREKLSVCSVIDGDAAAIEKGMEVSLP